MGNVISKDGEILIIPNKIRYRLLKLRRDKTIPSELKENKMRGYKQVIKKTETY